MFDTVETHIFGSRILQSQLEDYTRPILEYNHLYGGDSATQFDCCRATKTLDRR